MYTYVVDPDVGAEDVNTIQTSPVSTTDSHVVHLAILASIQNEMEHGSIDKDNVMYGKVGDLFYTEQSSAVPASLGVNLVTVT